MKILVCFKVSPDTDNLTAQEAAAIRDGAFDATFAKRGFGAGDEAALACGLRLRDALAARGGQPPLACAAGDGTAGENPNSAAPRLTAVTVGKCPPRYFTELFAVRYDRVVHIPLGDAAGGGACAEDFAPAKTAAALAAFVRADGGYDLILTGQQAGPGESARLPGTLAAALGLPCIPRVYDVLPGGPAPGGLAVLARGDGEELALAVCGPAVCALGDAAHPYLPLSKLRDRMAAGKRQAESWTPAEDLPQGMLGDALPLRYIYEEKAGRCRFICGEGAAEKTDALFELLGDEAPCPVLPGR